MLRRLASILCALSLACAVALAGLWVMSWWRYPFMSYVEHATPLSAVVRCEDGVAFFIWWKSKSGGKSGFDAGLLAPWPTGTLGQRLRNAAVGFGVQSGMIGRGESTVGSMPLWALILLTALPPAMWAWRRRRQGARGFEVTAAASAPVPAPAPPPAASR